MSKSKPPRSLKKPTLPASDILAFAEGASAGKSGKAATTKVAPKASAAQRASQAGTGNANSRFPPSGDVRLTINLQGDIHLRLKIEAAKRRTTVGELVEELVQRHL